MRLYDIAQAFGLTTTQICEHIGYKRQVFYTGIKYTSKAREAIATLHDLNDSMWQADHEKAERNFIRRKKAILEFENKLKNGGGADV